MLSTLEFGNGKHLHQLKKGHRISCPWHHTDAADAFVIESLDGGKGIHCKVCRTSFWPDGNEKTHDFYALEEAARDVFECVETNGEEDRHPESVKAFPGLEHAKIHIQCEKYVNLDLFREAFEEPGVVFIKSRKGSGKTELLKSLVADSNKKILFVGHRRTLIRGVCRRLSINCYLDYQAGVNDGGVYDRVGICLDSLSRIEPSQTYDLIMIDESEQVLAHFLSNTMEDKRNDIIHRFIHLLGKAEQVVALDADLGWNSFKFLSEWARGDRNTIHTHLIINEFVRSEDEPSPKLLRFPSRRHIISDIQTAVLEGKRCYVTSNSKATIDRLEKTIAELIGEDTKVLKVTSDTTNRGIHTVDAFLENPASEAIQYQVVLASPAISSGVDISLSGNKPAFDVVYGIFNPLVLTHFDCDQQLARVRHARKVKVFMSGKRFNFDSHLDVIRGDLLSSTPMGVHIKGYTDEGPVFHQGIPLVDLACHVLAEQRSSKNDLRRHFLEHKQRQGWQISSVESDDELDTVGKHILMRGKALDDDAYERALMEARTLDDAEYEDIKECLKEEQEVRLDEKLSFERTSMEKFYDEEINSDMILRDRRGRLRQQVRTYQYATESPSEYAPTDRVDNVQRDWKDSYCRVLKSREVRKGILLAALSEAGLYEVDAHHFRSQEIITTDNLSGMVRFLIDNKTAFETQTDWAVGSEVRRKPMKMLNQILSEFGLSMSKVDSPRIDGKKIYRYQLNVNQLKEVARYERISRLGRTSGKAYSPTATIENFYDSAANTLDPEANDEPDGSADLAA